MLGMLDAGLSNPCFRPLIGVSFCKLFQLRHIPILVQEVSVPLSGLASVNRAMQFFYHSVNMRFRPLIGVSFCKRKVVYIGDYIDNVSVPLSGLASVNGMMDIGLPSQFYSFPSPYRG